MKRVDFAGLNGFVLSVELPAGGFELSEQLTAHSDYQDSQLNVVARGASNEEGNRDEFSLTMRVIENLPATIGNRYAPYEEYGLTVLNESRVLSFGSRRLSYEVTNQDSNGRPFIKVYNFISHGRVNIHYELNARDPDSYAALLPLFEKSARSILVSYNSEGDHPSYHHVETSEVSPGVFIDVTMKLPPGWSARQLIDVETDPYNPRGLFVTQFKEFNEEDARDHCDDECRRFERSGFPQTDADGEVIMIIEGVPDGPLTTEKYLALSHLNLPGLLSDPQPAATPAGAALPLAPASGFCLSANTATPQNHPNGFAHINTYLGSDPLSGEERKARVYASGGKNVACSLIFIADPKIFDTSLPIYEDIVRSLIVTDVPGDWVTLR